MAVTSLGVAVVDRWVAIPLAVLAGLAVDAALEAFAALVGRPADGGGDPAITGVVAGAADEPIPEDRAVMPWAEAETPPDATFAVIGYPADRGFIDWFPALSRRENFTTWQGTEWIPDAYTGRKLPRRHAAAPPIASRMPTTTCCGRNAARTSNNGAGGKVRPTVYQPI